MPTVSVIMNIRNGAATLREAIASVMAQTVPEWELIAWDDRSTDDSAAIVAEFRDPRIRYSLAPQEMPLGQARDAAIRQAWGEWLAFLDQDDVWLPQKLEKQLALAEPSSVGLIYGRTLAIYPNGGQRDLDYFHEFSPLPEGKIQAELLGRGCFIAMSSVLLRRPAVLESGGVPGCIHVSPDYSMYLSVCSRYQARAVQQVVCRYRVHSESMSNVYRRQTLEETLLLVEQWREALPPAEFQRRRSHICTALAFEDFRRPKTFAYGLRRLVNDGSVFWLMGRPFVHLWRRLRRGLRRPYWKQLEHSAAEDRKLARDASGDSD